MTNWEYYTLVEIQQPDNNRDYWTLDYQPKTVVKGGVIGQDGTIVEHTDSFGKKVNTLGQSGWELIFVDPSPRRPLLNRYIFKRPIGGQ